jgi:lipopolysaccharide/colanic/teichoic acid biosynthesis glycosyltransferase
MRVPGSANHLTSRLATIETIQRQFGLSPWRIRRAKARVAIRKLMWWIAVQGALFTKRLVDIIVAAALILLIGPILLLLAMLIRATDGGPVLFWQERVGKWGQTFRFPKFRSMVTNAEDLKDELLAQNEHGEGVTFKIRRDPRVTWIGRIMRRGSLDELPQLWCVLKGEMSLVGPRPPVPREVVRYSVTDRRRLEGKPGLTCIWQVSGRADIPFPEQVKLDVEYLEFRGFWFDLKLLARTVPAVLLGRGAY